MHRQPQSEGQPLAGDRQVHVDAVLQKRQLLRRHAPRKGDHLRQRAAADEVIGIGVAALALHIRFKRRMVDAHDVRVGLQRQHAHRVPVRREHGLHEQPVHVLARAHLHLASGDHRLRLRKRFRRHMVEHAHARRRIACRHAHRRAQRDAALIRAGNAHAHGVLIEVVVQRDRQALHLAHGIRSGRRRVQRDGHRLRAARRGHDRPVHPIQKEFVRHLYILLSRSGWRSPRRASPRRTGACPLAHADAACSRAGAPPS